MSSIINDTKKELVKKFPRFGTEIANAKIEFTDDLQSHTAATDGRNIYIDRNYFESLNKDERIFLIAHEIMHIKFRHMDRLIDKDGKQRDSNLWNIATDAIINANLARDGFTIKEGYVDMPEALKYSSEEFYQILLERKQNEQKNNNQQQGDSSGQDSGNVNQNGENEQENHGDDHSLWGKSLEKQQEQEQQDNDNNADKQTSSEEQQPNEMDFNEKDEFENNRNDRNKLEEFEITKSAVIHKMGGTERTINGDIGRSQEEIPWQLKLKRLIEKNDSIWSQDRSIAENNFAYRLVDYDVEDEAESEVMIDVSGSVSDNLVKSFLRQVKPILQSSKLKVGFFDTLFYGFSEIKDVKDIDRLQIPGGGGTDLDLPVRSFTKKKEINKIIFTDGYAWGEGMPKEDLKNEDIIWLVYGNKDFKPCCGKVIYITEKQLKKLQLLKMNSIEDDGR